MKYFNLFAITTLIIILISCNEEIDITRNDTISIDPISESYYSKIEENLQRNSFSKNLAEALKDKEFRVYLKNESLKQIDGDYDVYLRTLWEEGKKEDSQFKKMIQNDLYLKSNSAKGQLPNLEINDPNLMIYIPSPEQWNPDSEIPVVCYLPLNFNEDEIRYLKGYNHNGHEVKISTEKQPDFPVMIIRKSETIEDNFDFKGNNSYEALSKFTHTRDIIPIEKKCPVPPPSPVSNVQISAVNARIQISWDAADGPTKYDIYYSYNSIDFKKILTTTSTIANFTLPEENRKPATIKIEAFNCVLPSNRVPVIISTVECLVPAPIITEIEPTSSGIDLIWATVDNAAGYILKYETSNGTKYSKKLSGQFNTSTTISGFNCGEFIRGTVSSFNGCGVLISENIFSTYYTNRSFSKQFTIENITYKNKIEPWYLGKLDWTGMITMQSETNAENRSTYTFNFKTPNQNSKWSISDNDQFVTTHDINKQLGYWKAKNEGYIVTFGIIEQDFLGKLGGKKGDTLYLETQVKLTGIMDTKWGSTEGIYDAGWTGKIPYKDREDEVWEPININHFDDPESSYQLIPKNHNKGDITVKFTEL